ncbi:hypothetical protein Plav_1958 [Parvibaculum lavamentivorans DS-1]|uniref:SGNH hydrolase-type esterase domain-containing protein n=1 Tax=Parvibaculum lavamentivorans (strain DS-1 / DSM 13023 / NCIMB 13966) TaxID=402881 RepID=A7HUJ0_PARL1|nr:hypothetical protein Plav_1958 [Parvibaculum lavamentivorans DS-1]
MARQTSRKRAARCVPRFALAVFAAFVTPLQAAECENSPRGLEQFHSAIRDIEAGERSRPLTILHLGDSHISLDTFTRGLRTRWEERFGSAGRGLMPGVPFQYYAPDGFNLAMTGPWSIASSLPADASGPFGLQGFRASAETSDAVMTLEAAEPFSRIELELYGGPDTGAVLLKLDNAAALKLATRMAKPGLLRITVPAADARRATLRPSGSGPVHLLGWAVARKGAGVRYDSYGIVAATAAITNRWDKDIVGAQVAALKPDLVIFGYGTNEGYNNGLDVEAYSALLGGFISLMASAAPEASIALLGPFDGARRGSGEACSGGWATPPKLALLRDAQRALAEGRGGFFWDGAAAMGGRCSADDWARASPPLMYADRVHLRRKGAERLSARLWEALMTGLHGEGVCAPTKPSPD